MFSIILSAIFSVSAIAVLYCLYMLNYVLPKKRQRVTDVYAFRIRMIEENMEVYDALPSYEEMLTDGKELKIENYLPNAKV